MGRLKIGVIIDSFRLGVKEGIRKAASLGVDGFQIWATYGEMAPENLTQTGRRPGDRQCGEQQRGDLARDGLVAYSVLSARRR